MTAKELIKILKRFPKTAIVRVAEHLNDDVAIAAQVNEKDQWSIIIVRVTPQPGVNEKNID